MWPVPLSAAVVAALLCVCAVGDLALTGDYQSVPGQQYQGFTYTLNDPAGGSSYFVDINMPVLLPPGLTFRGMARTDIVVPGAIRVNGADARDGSVILHDNFVRNGRIEVVNTLATMASLPILNLDGFNMQNNVTVMLAATRATYTSPGAVVSFSPPAQAASMAQNTGLYIVKMRVSGAQTVLRYQSGGAVVIPMVQTSRNTLAIHDVTATGLRDAVVMAGSPWTVRDNSVVRLTKINVVSSPAVSGQRVTVIRYGRDVSSMSVEGGSLFVMRDISIAEGGLMMSPRSDFSFTADGDARVSFIGVTAAFGVTGSAAEVPKSDAGMTYESYGDSCTIGGRRLTSAEDYLANTLNVRRVLTNGKDASGVCQPATCLGVNTGGLSATCACECRVPSSRDMCAFNQDSAYTFTPCTDENCVQCNMDPNTCQVCRSGTFLRTGRCFPSLCDVRNCRGCVDNDPARCRICINGFGVVGGVCVQCTVPRCQECNGNANTCNVCLAGYTLSGGTCTQASDCSVPGCRQCAAGEPSVCAVCSDGFGLTSSGQCIRCQASNCVSCRNDPSRCSACRPGYTTTAAGTCTQQCSVANCAICRDGSPSTCIQCNGGYLLDANSKCVSQSTCGAPNCIQCGTNNAARCTQCQPGYSLVSGRCHPYGSCFVNYCITCEQFDPVRCVQCSRGYVVSRNSGLCVRSNGAALTSPRTAWAGAALALLSLAAYLV